MTFTSYVCAQVGGRRYELEAVPSAQAARKRYETEAVRSCAEGRAEAGSGFLPLLLGGPSLLLAAGRLFSRRGVFVVVHELVVHLCRQVAKE